MPCGGFAFAHCAPGPSSDGCLTCEMTGSKTRNRISMKHIVIPETVEGCDCEDCRAGRHLYSLFCWRDGEWSWRATSLRAYTSVEECKQKHPWMLVFEPGSTWEA